MTIRHVLYGDSAVDALTSTGLKRRVELILLATSAAYASMSGWAVIYIPESKLNVGSRFDYQKEETHETKLFCVISNTSTLID